MKNRVLRTHATFVAVLAIVAAFLVVHPPTAEAGSKTTTNACFSNATATYSDLGWSLAGTGAPNPATVGSGLTLGGGTVGVDIPATLLIAGYNLGLLTVGANSIPTTVYVARSATNATPSTQVDHFAITATTTITDPNGTPGTGDESATPLAVSQALPNMVVTPIGGTVAFSQAAPGTLPLLPAGVAGAGAVQPKGSLFASASVAGGLIRANFDCFPGTTNVSPAGGTSGPTFTPATPAPFEQVPVSDSGSTTTTDGSSSTSTSSTSTSSTSTTSTTTAPSSTTTSTTSSSTTTTASGATSVTGTGKYTASCSNSVTPDKSELTFAITGTAPASVVAGSKVSLSEQSWTVDVPASVLQTGINLGLLSIGQTVNGTVTPGLFASNTAEGSLQAAATPVVIGPIEADSNGQALPASATFAVGAVTWTSVGGDVGYSFDQTKVLVEIGPLKVTFTCLPPSPSDPIVTTKVSGQTDIPPAGRTTPATVEAATVTAETLPVTGVRNLGLEIIFALVLIDAGYLLWSASRPSRRRRHA